MGKHDPFSPKAIANKIKAKGLQKLRWYCQMCQKQCRDENGFKCHCASEGHIRQMQIFAETPGKFTENFSQTFERSFMDFMKRKYRNQRVLANRVYNEVIKDKTHVHLNSTRWASLSGFVMYLGKSGQCIVEDTPKGWYISYIEKDADILRRQASIAAKESMDLGDEDRTQRLIMRKIKAAQKLAAQSADPNAPAAAAPAEGRGDGACSAEAEDEEVDILGDDDDDADGDDGDDADSDAGDEGDEGDAADACDDAGDAEACKAPAEGEGSPAAAAGDGPAGAPQEAPKAAAKPAAPVEPPRPLVMFALKPGAPLKLSAPLAAAPAKPAVAPVAPVAPVVPVAPATAAAAPPARAAPLVVSPVPVAKSPATEVVAVAAPSAQPPAAKRQRTEEEAPAAPKDPKDLKDLPGLRKLSELREEMEQSRERKNRRRDWVAPGIVVKVMAKDLAHYYKLKGSIESVQDGYLATIRMLDTGHLLRVDQDQLETVLPGVDVDKFCAQVKIAEGEHAGRVVEGVAYEDVCKTLVQAPTQAPTHN
eukprot:m51a1_g13704 hypothetical protein (535) ;mRNA; r:74027-76299